MLKWIGGGCVVLLLVIAAVMYAGYKQMSKLAEEGPSVTVAVAATPERVFASMGSADSLSTWLMSGSGLRTARKGALVAGDSIFVAGRNDSMPSAWIIDSVVPNQLIVSRWVVVTNGMVIHGRRDSLVAAGDSTRVTSTIRAGMSDSLAALRNRMGEGVVSGMMDMSAKMTVAGARIQAEAELKRLKSRIEGPKAMRP